MNAVVQKLIGTMSVTKDQILEMVELLPDGETLVPFAVNGVANDGTPLNLVGYFSEEAAKQNLTEDKVDAFSVALLREVEKPIPAGAVKTVSMYGIRIAVKG
ncbi:hypothetical protein SAMN02799624_05321 [Paenibacillus sp. UNC496MF]|uniref:hypothetical protein n=1 Tax=Paenibacillus sp. UNC496MF TaxID=1502753 RepID=UPI0008F2B223|nr:hypothetical protein [Paenibacillus sp. UNC496MF]SFJ64109.1 hypothetical protein SAMN02799624_05321 [Paenibacillus sp. UNC496MF]